MRRHKRKNALSEIRAQQFADNASQAHQALVPFLRELKPKTPQYRVVLSLSHALYCAVERITGKAPPWASVRPSESHDERNSSAEPTETDD